MRPADCQRSPALHVGECEGVQVLVLGLGVRLELEHVVEELEVGDGAWVLAVPEQVLLEPVVPSA